MKKVKSEGNCCFCKKTYTKAGISKHLKTHLVKASAMEIGKKKKYYHLKVEADSYFINIIISSKQNLKNLDSFLRAIWLECCGHLSMFGDWREEISMTSSIDATFKNRISVGYNYDFGSTTSLTIKNFGAFELPYTEGIILLSRNEPLKLICTTCKKEPATTICTVHWDEPNTFCDDCADLHEEECEDAEYALMPVINSPRIGACAYDGGIIDTERDGIYEGKI